jgi:hypothetical protein
VLERRQAEPDPRGLPNDSRTCEHVFGGCGRDSTLADAAELVVLAADDYGPSFDRWAVRWAARYVLKERNVTLGEAGRG